MERVYSYNPRARIGLYMVAKQWSWPVQKMAMQSSQMLRYIECRLTDSRVSNQYITDNFQYSLHCTTGVMSD